MGTDIELLDAWCGGDNVAGDALIRRHFEAVCRFFRGKLGEDVEDLIQRTFQICTVRRRDLAVDGSFRGFLFGVARNLLLDHLRRVYRRGPPGPEGRGPARRTGVIAWRMRRAWGLHAIAVVVLLGGLLGAMALMDRSAGFALIVAFVWLPVAVVYAAVSTIVLLLLRPGRAAVAVAHAVALGLAVLAPLLFLKAGSGR